MDDVMVLINEEGQLLEIDPKETSEDSILVPLKGYYEVLNEQRYPEARYDFELKTWVGVGEQRPIEVQPISETQKLWDMIDYLVKATEIVPSEPIE